MKLARDGCWKETKFKDENGHIRLVRRQLLKQHSGKEIIVITFDVIYIYESFLKFNFRHETRATNKNKYEKLVFSSEYHLASMQEFI